MNTPDRDGTVLWISSEIYTDTHAGSHIYSAGLREGLIAHGFAVTILAVRRGGEVFRGPENLVEVSGTPSRTGRVLSREPDFTARLPLKQLRIRLDEQLEHGWTCVAIDHIKSGWALRQVTEARTAGLVDTVWYASQNNESVVYREALRRGYGSLHETALRGLDMLRIYRAQRRLLALSDVVSGITDVDSDSFRKTAKGNVVTAMPAHTQPATNSAPSVSARPRSVLVAGSFLWRLKLLDLRAFLTIAAERFREANLPLVVAGQISDRDLARLRADYPAVSFLGSVASMSELYRVSRLAVIPEVRGGGFKMKVPEFVYSSVPICATHRSMVGTGLDPSMYLGANSLAELVDVCIRAVDDLESLESVSRRALQKGVGAESWKVATSEVVRCIRERQAN